MWIWREGGEWAGTGDNAELGVVVVILAIRYSIFTYICFYVSVVGDSI